MIEANCLICHTYIDTDTNTGTGTDTNTDTVKAISIRSRRGCRGGRGNGHWHWHEHTSVGHIRRSRISQEQGHGHGHRVGGGLGQRSWHEIWFDGVLRTGRGFVHDCKEKIHTYWPSCLHNTDADTEKDFTAFSFDCLSFRGFPIDSVTLPHIVTWLVSKCGRPQTECRHRCMRLFCVLAPLLPGMR